MTEPDAQSLFYCSAIGRLAEILAIKKHPASTGNVVHLRGAALRLTGYRVFDIFTALGRFGLGRLSIK
ncbi:hypothetical protein ABMY14_20755, partial [Vibrio vulnificus]